MASPDFVFANSSGAVVIPAPSLHRVLEVAPEFESQDSLFMKEIRTEEVPL
jgi:regulator of RNase E activity RraA